MTFPITFDIEGIEELEGTWKAALTQLNDELTQACQETVIVARDAMRANHPYTDRTTWLTESSYLTPPVQTRWTTYCEIRFRPNPDRGNYAWAVNYGVPGRSRPYPFIPIGEKAAEQVFQGKCIAAMGRFCDNVNRR